MVTPELLNYIQQARAQGLSNDAIRQNLVSGGWNAADVDSALGGAAPVAATAPVAAGKSHKGLIITIVVVLLILGGLGFAGQAAVSYFLSRNGGQLAEDIIQRSIDSSINYNMGQTPDNIDDGSANDPKPKGCGTELKGQLPFAWPAGLPKYPGAVATEVAVLVDDDQTLSSTTQYCTTDTAAKVEERLVADGKDWQMKRAAYTASGDSTNITLNGASGNSRVMIMIEANAGRTKIGYFLITEKKP